MTNSFNRRIAVPAWLLACVGLIALLVGAQGSLSAQATDASHADASADAERDALWNSAAMLRARAWVQEYCERSAKISDAEGKKYMQELASLTPSQMKLWLLKFEEEHQQLMQRQATWQKVHSAANAHALAADRAAQASMADINREQSAAADQADQRLERQQQNAEERSADKQTEAALESHSWGPGLNDGLGYGGYHVHYHLYPY